MKTSKGKITAIVLFLATVCTIILLPPLLTPKPDLENATEKAVDFLKDTKEPYVLLWLDVMNRKFGIPEFSDALQRYDELLSEEPENGALLRIFRRMADNENRYQPDDLEALYAEVDYLIVPALYCHQQQLPEDYPEMLENAASKGEYQLTHVLLALIFIEENNCSLWLPEGFVESVYSSNAQLIDDDQRVTDLELEAAAFLYLANQGNRVNSSFVEKVIDSQKNDGGWTITGKQTDQTNWHPTILALTVLLHEQYPAASYPPILPQASN